MQDDYLIKINIDDVKYNFQHEISYFNEYLTFNIDKLNKRKKQLDLMQKQDIHENPDSEAFFESFYYLDYIKIPSHFYNSSIVSLYTFFETNLNKICDKIQAETDLVIGLNDLAGSNIIQKGRKFLSRFVNVDFDQIDKEWIKITDFQKLRNLIVHQNSQIRNNSKEDAKIIEYFNGIKLEKDNSFFITNADLLFEFLSLIEAFIINIYDQIEKKSFKKFQLVKNDFILDGGCDFELDDLPF
jgi:hypothetical protein